jgi:hypothetical protein
VTDWELWACANQVRAQHGEGAFAVIGERLAAMEQAGDKEGYRVWSEIAVRVAKLGPVVDPDITRH